MHNVKKHPNFLPVDCPYHNDNLCLQIIINDKRFHCLFERDSAKWCFYNCSKSCDIPEYMYDLIELNKSLGSDYVLPFSTHFREESGFTVGLYELQNGMFTAKILKPEHLFECFLTFIVIMCQACHLYGGNCPQMNRMKFIYSKQHPVLVDVGKENCNSREKIGNRNISNEKKWNRFLNSRTTKEIIHYVKVHHPEYFKKKSKANTVCLLSGEFNDDTHYLICKCRKMSLKNVLETFMYNIPNLTERINKLLNNDTSR